MSRRAKPKRKPRCPVCATRRATFTSLLAHQAKSGHSGPCRCGGYHYPHRPGSPCCEENGYALFNRVKRAGAKGLALLDARIDSILHGKHKPTKKAAPCPF